MTARERIPDPEAVQIDSSAANQVLALVQMRVERRGKNRYALFMADGRRLRDQREPRSVRTFSASRVEALVHDVREKITIVGKLVVADGTLIGSPGEYATWLATDVELTALAAWRGRKLVSIDEARRRAFAKRWYGALLRDLA